ncbi:MAG: hypothetical protein ABDH63_05765 [Candidatus Caldarchaeales archaeon]
MDVWLSRGGEEVLVELPPEARVEFYDPVPVGDLSEAPEVRAGELVVVDASHLKPESVGEVVERLRPARAAVTTWLAHGSAPDAVALSRLRSLGLSTTSDDWFAAELRDSDELTYVSPPLALPPRLSSPESRARALLSSMGLDSEGKRVRAVACVLTPGGELMGFLEADRVPGAELRGEHDLVLLSPGGFPFDRTLLQVLLCLEPYSALCRERGVIGVVAECAEGLGSRRLLEAALSGNRVPGTVEGEALGSLESVRTRARVVASVPLPRTYVERAFGMRQAPRLQEAVTAATRFVGREIRAAVVRCASLRAAAGAAERPRKS